MMKRKRNLLIGDPLSLELLGLISVYKVRKFGRLPKWDKVFSQHSFVVARHELAWTYACLNIVIESS